MVISNKEDVSVLSQYWENWHNWTIDHKEELSAAGKAIVYYDSAHKYKGLEWEGNNVKEGAELHYTYTCFYLNGRKMAVNSYEDSLYKEIFFTPRGDTQWVNIINYKKGGFSRSRFWAEDLSTGKAYLERTESTGKTPADYSQNCFNAKGEKIACGRNWPPLHSIQLDFRDSLKLAPGRLDTATETIYLNLEKAPASFLKKLDILATLPRLKELDIYGWPKEEFPAFVLQCTKLEKFSIGNSKVKVIPASISRLAGLHSIQFTMDSALDYETSFKNLAALPALRSLIIPLDFGKPLPQNLGLLKNLFYLSIGDYGLCTKDSSPEVNIKIIYQLKQLRRLEVCYDQFYKIDPFDFAKHLPNCRLTQVETCFTAASKILLADGNEKSIAQIRTGDRVLAYDSLSGKFDTATVLKTFMHQQPMKGTLEFFVQSDEDSTVAFHFNVTALHPFYTTGQWKIAGDLKTGDALLYRKPDGTEMKVKITAIETVSETVEPVYNIRTSKHTYVVNGIVAHNK